MKSLSIGKLSNATGVNIETIRYYEREKILPVAVRDSGGRRIYDEEDVKRLHFIHKCRGLGFSLKEINSLLSLVISGVYTCKEINDLTLVHASQVSEKIADLRRMESVLLDMAAQCSKGSVPDCPIVDSLYN